MSSKTRINPTHTKPNANVHCRNWLKRKMASAVENLRKPDWRTLDSMVILDDGQR